LWGSAREGGCISATLVPRLELFCRPPLFCNQFDAQGM
jgi:hypothetical protein